MAHRPSKRRSRSEMGDDLNLTPMIDIFMIIIFFLLLTAIFAKTAIINIYLPQESGGAHAGGPQETLTVRVKDNGFELGGIGAGNFIAKTGTDFNYTELTNRLSAIKDRYPHKEDIVLLFDQGTPYDTVVKVMDAARETENGNRRPLFPFVSLGESR